MKKTAKTTLAVIKKVCNKFAETQEFIDKGYIEECCKEKISFGEVLFSINNNCKIFFCVMLLWFSLVSYIVMVHYFLLYLIGSRSF